MPYRVDVPNPPHRVFDTLVDLGALDVERVPEGLAALMPDAVSPAMLARALGVRDVRVSRAVGRDDASVWTLSPRPVRVGTLWIVPAGLPAPPGALTIADGRAFGTGLHPTTALCLEALENLFAGSIPSRVLDIGTGSGILALAALRRGVERAVGLDIDPAALQAAAENARLNDVASRFLIVRGSVDALRGSWPLVVANIRAAELMEMAPTLVRRVASGGRLVLSGIPRSVAADVEREYRRLGTTNIALNERDGWTALVFSPSW